MLHVQQLKLAPGRYSCNQGFNLHILSTYFLNQQVKQEEKTINNKLRNSIQ